jgi:gamma-glutamylcyclotransferase (GGCT)/AIG2-like uncharacterized protein YtfP
MLGENAKYIKDVFIKGRLFVHFIPFLIHGNRDIQGELWDISKEAFEKIKGMEERAGYITEKVMIDNEPVYLFRYPAELKVFENNPDYIEVSNY